MTTWNELPAHLVNKIRSDSVTPPANLPGTVPALKYGNAITEVERLISRLQKLTAMFITLIQRVCGRRCIC